MSHQEDPRHDPELSLDVVLAQLDSLEDSWTHTLPDGRTIRALIAERWVVSVWFAGEMLEIWEDKPYGMA